MADEDRRTEARRQMWVTIAFVLAGTVVAQLAVVGALVAAGYELSELQSGGFDDLPRSMLALVLGLTQLLSYLVPGVLAAHLLFRKGWPKYVGLGYFPSLPKLLLGLLLFACTLYLTAALASVNAQIDLSDWQADIETDVAALLGTLIGGEGIGGLLLALLLVAVLPAVGEELVFRGLFQPALIGTSGSVHLGIWMTALLFGLVHGQFAGLLPRVFLGGVLGFLAYNSRSLWLPIIAHFLFNGLQVIAVRFAGLEVQAPSADSVEKVETLELAAALFLAGAAMYFLLPRIRPTVHASATNGAEGEDTEVPTP